MEIGFAGFLFCCMEWGGRRRKNKEENGNVLAGQAGVEVASWRETVGLVRKEKAKGCWPAGAGRELTGWRGCLV